MPPKSLRAIATNFSGGFIDATSLSYSDSYLLCFKLFASALDARGSERGRLGVTCATSREGRGEVLGGHRGNGGEIDTHTAVSVARALAPRDEVKQLVISGARVRPGDAHESGPAVELDAHLRAKVLEHWQHQVVADQAGVANAEPLRALHAAKDVLCEGGS